MSILGFSDEQKDQVYAKQQEVLFDKLLAGANLSDREEALLVSSKEPLFDIVDIIDKKYTDKEALTNIIFSTLHEVNFFIFDFLVGNADEAQLAEIVAYMKEYVAQAEKNQS